MGPRRRILSGRGSRTPHGDSGFREGIKENIIIEFVQNGADRIVELMYSE